MYHIDFNTLDRLYAPQYGRGLGDDLPYYRSNYNRQRGAGLGAILGAFAKRLIPFAKNILWPAAKKHVLPYAATAASGLAEDVLAGKNFRESFNNRSKTAMKEVGSSAIKAARNDFLNHSQAGVGLYNIAHIRSQVKRGKKRKASKSSTRRITAKKPKKRKRGKKSKQLNFL